MEPDQGLIVAVQRDCGGAKLHKANQLLQVYSDHCYLGNEAKAEQDKRNLYRLLRTA